jgi:hypothetical protein
MLPNPVMRPCAVALSLDSVGVPDVIDSSSSESPLHPANIATPATTETVIPIFLTFISHLQIVDMFTQVLLVTGGAGIKFRKILTEGYFF